MGFIDDKNNLVDQIGLFKTIGDLPSTRKTSSIDSVLSKSKNLIPFLLDLLTISCQDDEEPKKIPQESRPSFIGSDESFYRRRENALPAVPSLKDKTRCDINRIVLSILVQFLARLVKIIKEGLIKAIKESFSCGSDFKLPTPTPVFTSSVKNIDFNDLMKIDPTSEAGKLLYGNDPNTDMNLFLYNTIQSPGTTNTWSGPNGPLLNITFNSPDQLTTQVHPNYGGQNFDYFLKDYLNSIELFSIKNVNAKLLDHLFGAVSSPLNMGVEKMVDQEKTNKIMDKILDTDPCVDEIIFDDSYFSFSNSEMEDIENRSNQRSSNNALLDVGCGVVSVTVPFETLTGLTSLDTLTPELVEDRITQTFDGVGDIVSNPFSESNRKVAKNGFAYNTSLSLPNVLMWSTITPKTVLLYQISHQTVESNILNVTSNFEFSKSASIFFEFVLRESFAALIDVIYTQVKYEILRLVSRVVSKIIKEKIRIYITALNSIILPTIGGGLGVNNLISAPNV